MIFCVSITNLKGAFTKIFRKYALITLICGLFFNGQNIKNFIKHPIIIEMISFFVAFLRKKTIILKEISNFVGKLINNGNNKERRPFIWKNR